MKNLEQTLLTLPTQDMTYLEIAQAIGRSLSYTYKLLLKYHVPYKHGIKGGNNHVGGKRHPKTDRIMELHNKGLTVAVISERLGAGKGTVQTIINRNKRTI